MGWGVPPREPPTLRLGRRAAFPMIFESFSKNLCLCVKHPWIENGASGQPPTVHPGEYIKFTKHKFETEDEKEIKWLKKHKSFSEDPGLPNKFWPWTPPVDKDALIRENKAYIAQLEEENRLLREKAEAKAAKTAASPKAPATPPVTTPPTSGVQTGEPNLGALLGGNAQK